MMMRRRMRTDRSEQLSPYDVVTSPNIEITLSPFLFNRLEFTIQRKIVRLNRATQSIIDSRENSTEQLDALKNLTSLIVADPRLSDHLSDHLSTKVFRCLIRFLKDNKSFEFQYYSAAVLQYLLSSEIGLEFIDQAILSLVKLIPSPDTCVQTQALLTLTKIADKFPDSCNAMINNGALDHLDSLLTNECNDFGSLKNGGQLLTAFCRIKPHLTPDKLGKVVRIISIAINQDSPPVLLQVCLALSILSDQRLVEIGTEVVRLVNLINDLDKEIVFCALRTIGNYVRWASDEENKLMITPLLLAYLGELLHHGYTIVRKEACWIFSNITAVANSDQLNLMFKYLDLLDTLIDVVTHDALDVVLPTGENCTLKRSQHQPLLPDIRHNEPVSLPTNEEGRSSSIVHMTTGSQQTENATRKKELRRRKEARRRQRAQGMLTYQWDSMEFLGILKKMKAIYLK